MRMKKENGDKKGDQFEKICERENIVMNSLIYFEPVKRFQNRSDVMKFRSFGDGTSSRIKHKLKTISLSSREIE